MIGIRKEEFGGPYFIHSDIFAVRQLMAGKKMYSADVLLPAHQNFLEKSLGDDIVFPAFNYDFPKSGAFNVKNDPVQVGVLPNNILKMGEYYRSEVPMYSVISKKTLGLKQQKIIQPFGKGSFFEKIYQRNGTIVFYGAAVSSMTFIHYIETVLGMPLYRYDKKFKGHIINDKEKYPCELLLHVRPMGVHLDYNWNVIEEDLISEKIIEVSSVHPLIKYVSTAKLVAFFKRKVEQDPFYLIDDKSKQYFKVKTNNGSDRVELKDFEC